MGRYQEAPTVSYDGGKKQATVNGKTVTLDVAPQLLNDRTMVPLRFVVESLGAIVEWEDVTQTVTIRYGK